MTNERCELRHRPQEDGDGGVPVGEQEDGRLREREDGSGEGIGGMLVAW